MYQGRTNVKCLLLLNYSTPIFAGEKCPIVGRVSMDAVTVWLPCCPEDAETYTMMTTDFDPDTSATGIASKVGTISYEVVTRLSTRYPRVYIAGQTLSIVNGLGGDVY